MTTLDEGLALLPLAGIPKRYRLKIDGGGDQDKTGPWWKMGQVIWARMGQGSIFALLGKSGTGKTQTACNLIYLNCVQKCVPSLYTTTRDFFLAIKDAYRRESPVGEIEVIAGFVKPGLLVLDELDKRGETDWENSLLEHLINKRYGAMKDTLLISNQNMQGFEESIGPANLSRLNETGGIALCEWPSFRELPEVRSCG